MEGEQKTGRLFGKQLLGNLALSVAAILVALVIGEVLLRSFFKDQIVLFPRYHTDAKYGEFTIRRIRPNSVFWHTSVDGTWKFVIDAQGFRNETDFSYDKPPGIVRVLSLGDSNTQGYEVRQEHTFSAVIERYLRGNGVRAEVINAGVSGFGTAEELVFLENEGLKYHPDVVVLGFYANDFEDNIKAGIFAVEKGVLSIKKTEHIPGVRILNALNEFALLRWLSENSYVYSFGLNGIWDYAKELLRTRTKASLTTEYAIPVAQVDDYQSELMGLLIERMYGFCRQNNIRLVILDIPEVSQGNELQSSVPPALYEKMRANSDLFIYSKEALHEYRNVAEFHVPHGHHHISEFTHLIYGVEVARALANSNKSNKLHSLK